MATTVLIVDDHPSFRATARMLLEAEGYEVVGEADDGSSAIRCAERLGPEVVLLDVNLPDLDGFAVADALRRSASAVVLISSRDEGDFGGLVSASGAVGFIAKGELSGDTLAEVLGR
jgi:DNA-binding NarL/FixJ family response regulator